jgi:hypothetical protein
MQVHLEHPDVHVVQGVTFGWFGFPEDTTPSSRDVVPGLSSGGGGSSQEQVRTLDCVR